MQRSRLEGGTSRDARPWFQQQPHQSSCGDVVPLNACQSAGPHSYLRKRDRGTVCVDSWFQGIQPKCCSCYGSQEGEEEEESQRERGQSWGQDVLLKSTAPSNLVPPTSPCPSPHGLNASALHLALIRADPMSLASDQGNILLFMGLMGCFGVQEPRVSFSFLYVI